MLVHVQEQKQAESAMKELKRREARSRAARPEPPLPGDDARRQEAQRQQENDALREAYNEHVVSTYTDAVDADAPLRAQPLH